MKRSGTKIFMIAFILAVFVFVSLSVTNGFSTCAADEAIARVELVGLEPAEGYAFVQVDEYDVYYGRASNKGLTPDTDHGIPLSGDKTAVAFELFDGANVTFRFYGNGSVTDRSFDVRDMSNCWDELIGEGGQTTNANAWKALTEDAPPVEGYDDVEFSYTTVKEEKPVTVTLPAGKYAFYVESSLGAVYLTGIDFFSDDKTIRTVVGYDYDDEQNAFLRTVETDENATVESVSAQLPLTLTGDYYGNEITLTVDWQVYEDGSDIVATGQLVVQGGYALITDAIVTTFILPETDITVYPNFDDNYPVFCDHDLSDLPATIPAVCKKGDEILPDEILLNAVWSIDPFDENAVSVTLTAADGYVFGNGESVATFTVQISVMHNYVVGENCEYCTVCGDVIYYEPTEYTLKTVFIGSEDVFERLLEYGVTVQGDVTFYGGETDAYMGAKLGAGGKLSFKLNKTSLVVLGVGSLNKYTSLDLYKAGDLEDNGATQKYLRRITSFEDKNRQTITLALDEGEYVLENSALNENSCFSLNYVVVDDGCQEAFIPTESHYFAPRNHDADGFVGWTDGISVYTYGAPMPVAESNENVIVYRAVYGQVEEGFGIDGTFVGWLIDGEAYYSTFAPINGQVWSALYADISWLDGAALRSAGASATAKDDNSALKFRAFVSFYGGLTELTYASGDVLPRLVELRVFDRADIDITYRYSYSAASDSVVYDVYLEKIASKGLLDEMLAPEMSIGGAEYVTGYFYMARFIAEKALADVGYEALGAYVFTVEEGVFSRFTKKERTDLTLYITVAEAEEAKKRQVFQDTRIIKS